MSDKEDFKPLTREELERLAGEALHLPGCAQRWSGRRSSSDLSTSPAGDDASPPPPPPPNSAHVGDLDRSSLNLTSTRWRARATIRVHNGDHGFLSGVVVRGRFGPKGAALTCTTGLGGACTLRRDLRKSRASIVFVVLGLSKPSYVYAAGSNHDPDGDSDGTRITVTRP